MKKAVDIPNFEAYESVDRDDFGAQIEPDRYGDRSDTFDEIISATEGHFWDPDDRSYLDFTHPFDLTEQLLMPVSFTPELNCAVVDKLDERQQILFGNELTRFYLSQLLHGEQGALSLSASLCHIFRDPGAQEYAANQVREEARHVHALTRYFAVRWGAPLAAGGGLLSLLTTLVMTGEVYQKIVGMQMLVEGLALGAFSTIYNSTTDPVLRRMVQFILTDESYHHRFGRIWGASTLPKLNEEQRAQIENWAAGCFVTIFRNFGGLHQKQSIYSRFGFDWEWVAGAMREASHGDAAREALQSHFQLYRVLAKTLLQAGIITDRTRPLYRSWFDIDSLAGEPDGLSEAIAEATLAEFREIHREKQRTGTIRNRQL
ncbi:MAG TPA: ferritin-like domain-containing protein [Bryobacteraceae bacterium]|nr:ferritin-like domain-containing protein [Bryobacteraceae bacterium]